MQYYVNVDENDKDTHSIIAGYEVYRSGVPMIGEYVNGGRHSTITISPVVPGALYRITASALGNGKRSDTPAVQSATTEGASEYNIYPYHARSLGYVYPPTVICMYYSVPRHNTYMLCYTSTYLQTLPSCPIQMDALQPCTHMSGM